jgi:Zn ribbon nucleic-acid-binding protein
MTLDTITCPNCSTVHDMKEWKDRKITLTVFCPCGAYFHIYPDGTEWHYGSVSILDREQFIQEEMRTWQEIDEMKE